MKSVEQIWLRHCREREREHAQQMSTMRTRLGTMKTQMTKLRREMSELEAEIRTTEKNRVKEVAREKELTERFRHGFSKVHVIAMTVISDELPDVVLPQYATVSC